MTARLPENPADREATVHSGILGVVSSYGGQQIAAGPPMEQMVGDLTALVPRWLGDA